MKWCSLLLTTSERVILKLDFGFGPFLALLVVAAAVTGCSSPSLKGHEQQQPDLDLVEYFSGTTKAYGQFQDRFGKVRRRFVVDVEGTWDGTELQLAEQFNYSDGESEFRLWKLSPTGDNQWTGHADGVVGKAIGEVVGNAFNWKYEFDLATGPDKTLRVKFDDWLWLQTDKVLLNRTYISKYGVRVGEVFIVFEKIE